MALLTRKRRLLCSKQIERDIGKDLSAALFVEIGKLKCFFDEGHLYVRELRRWFAGICADVLRDEDRCCAALEANVSGSGSNSAACGSWMELVTYLRRFGRVKECRTVFRRAISAVDDCG